MAGSLSRDEWEMTAPSEGFEPAPTAPEADALSPELRGPVQPSGGTRGPSVAVRQRAVGGSKKTKRTPMVPSPDDRFIALRVVAVGVLRRARRLLDQALVAQRRDRRPDPLDLLDAVGQWPRIVQLGVDGKCRNRSVASPVRHGPPIHKTAA